MLPIAALALLLLLLAGVLFFWIPGVGIVLGLAGVGIAAVSAVSPSIASGGRAAVFAGAGLALLGALIIPFIDPILGTMMLLAGSAIAVASPLMTALATWRSRQP